MLTTVDSRPSKFAERFFDLACGALTSEADRVRGFPSTDRLLRIAGLRGLPTRSEAHLVHAIARALDNAGHVTLVNEPYPVAHPKGKVTRFDLKVTMDGADDVFGTDPLFSDPAFRRFLHVEVKRYLMIDKEIGWFVADIQKIRQVIAAEHGILATPIAFLAVGFSHNGRSDFLTRRIQSFVAKASLARWFHLERVLEVAADGQPMKTCLVDCWCLLDARDDAA